ncbi:MAG: V-type ATPase subunit [Nitrososphaerota archaeon]|nr:V-type ATPase subunit [Nitrososphaerota archaeon]
MSSKTYIGTKAFALRGSLLDSATVQKLSEAASLDELVNRLKSTSYAEAVTKLSPPFDARHLELALRERLATVHHTIAQSARKYGIFELYYLKDIAWDLKVVLKARALGRPYEETVEYLSMRAEELVGRRDLIVRVMSAKDVNEAVSMLSGTMFHADMEKALARYSSKQEVRFFDVYIDHAVLAAIAKEYSTNSKIYSSRPPNVNGVEEMVSLDLDAYNILAVLRSKLWGLSESETQELVISPGGRVPSSVLSSMARSDSVGEAIKLFDSAYHFELQGAQSDEDLIDLTEDRFAQRSKETATLAFVWQGLSPGTMLALVKLMEFEVSNLAAIALGVEAGIEPKRVASKLRT